MNRIAFRVVLLAATIEAHPGPWVLGGLSFCYIFIAPEFFFERSDIFAFIREGHLNEVGDFLSGFFTPLAFAWLVFGYFLQSKELRLQRRELSETQYTLRKQVKLLEEQLRRDR